MLRRNVLVSLFAIAGLVLWLGLEGRAQQQEQQSTLDSGGLKHWRDLSNGQIVATGVADPNNPGECVFAQLVGTAIDAVAGEKRTLTLEKDANCNLRVKEKKIEQAPRSVLPPGVVTGQIARMQQRRPVPVLFGQERNNGPHFVLASATLSAAACCTGPWYGWIVDHKFWTYGYPGAWDVLTVKRGYMNYVTNYVDYVYLNYMAPSCYTIHSWWVVDGCQVNTIWPGGSLAAMLHTGNYHMELYPGTAFYHGLVNRETGYIDGTAWCEQWISGSWPAGPTATCVRQ